MCWGFKPNSTRNEAECSKRLRSILARDNTVIKCRKMSEDLCWLCFILAPQMGGGPGDTGYWSTGKMHCWLQNEFFCQKMFVLGQEDARYDLENLFSPFPIFLFPFPPLFPFSSVFSFFLPFSLLCFYHEVSVGKEKSPFSSMCVPIALATSVFDIKAS